MFEARLSAGVPASLLRTGRFQPKFPAVTTAQTGFIRAIALAAGWTLAPGAVAAPSPNPTLQAAPRYEFRAEHDPNGIGKFFMGREIARVMGHQAADWLERPERESEERSELLLTALKLKPGDVVADIGCGSGYYTRRLAKLVGGSRSKIPGAGSDFQFRAANPSYDHLAASRTDANNLESGHSSPFFRFGDGSPKPGRVRRPAASENVAPSPPWLHRSDEGGLVYAVDIQPEMLDLLTTKLAAEKIFNVIPILGTATDPRLPCASVDLILLVDVYHEFDHPFEMVAALCEALKPGGRIVFVEFRAEDPAVAIKAVHKMSEAQVRKEMTAHPLEWVETFGGLPQQHVIVFRKKAGAIPAASPRPSNHAAP